MMKLLSEAMAKVFRSMTVAIVAEPFPLGGSSLRFLSAARRVQSLDDASSCGNAAGGAS
jgi:hypothetical protein